MYIAKELNIMSKKLLPLLILPLLLVSCTALIIRPKLRSMSKELVIEEVKNGKKELQFVRMVHVARPEYYNAVVDEIKKAKENGAVLFYEFIDYDINDTLILRKTQKISGFIPSPENYQKITGKYLKKGVLEIQDNEKFMNIVNNKDFRVDYTPQRLVKEYEEEFGEVELTSKDYSIPFDEMNDNTVPEKNREVIILDHRNTHLAKEVNNSKYSKIIILYGGDHFSGFLEELKKIDSNWKKNKQRKIEIK